MAYRVNKEAARFNRENSVSVSLRTSSKVLQAALVCIALLAGVGCQPELAPQAPGQQVQVPGGAQDAGSPSVEPEGDVRIYDVTEASSTPAADGADHVIRGFVRSTKARSVRVVFEPDDGGAKVSTEPLRLDADAPVGFSVTLRTVTGQGDRLFRVRLHDDADDRVLTERGFVISVAPLKLDAVVERNYYVAEEVAQAVFRLRATRLEADLTAEVSVDLPDPQADLITRASVPVHARMTVPVPLLDVPVGSHPVRLRVLRGEEVLAEVDDVLLRRAPPPEGGRITQIDRDRRLLVVDGKPLLPIGVVGVPKEQLKTIADAGFNLTLRWKGESTYIKFDPAAPLEEQEAVVNPYLDAVHQAGLYAFEAPVKLSQYYFKYKDPNFDVEAAKFNQQVLPGIVDIARKHPAVIGYYSYDEPLYAQQAGVTEFAQVVRGRDPFHPVYVLFSIGVQNWPGAFDAVGRDFYPGLTTPLSEVHRYAAQSAESAHQWRTPYLYMPLFESSSGRPEALSGPMQRAQTYLALTAGAKGVLWWVWPAAYRGNWEMLQSLAAEMKALSPVLSEVAPEQTVTYSVPDTADALKVLIKNHGGKTWLIAANSLPNPLDVTLKLPDGYRGTAKVHFDGRTVQIDGGALQDAIEGYGRRVYELSEGGEWPEGAHLSASVVIGEAPPQPQTPPPASSRNLVRNSGFERDFAHLPAWPENWYPLDSIAEPGFIGAPQSRWAVDTASAWEGQRSLRLVKTTPGVATSTEMYNFSAAPAAEAGFGELPAGSYVASVYLKASAPDTSAWIFAGWNDTRIVKVGTSWQRFTVPFTLTAATKWHFLRVYLRQQGTLWIDAAQVELGTAETPYVPGD